MLHNELMLYPACTGGQLSCLQHNEYRFRQVKSPLAYLLSTYKLCIAEHAKLVLVHVVH